MIGFSFLCIVDKNTRVFNLHSIFTIRSKKKIVCNYNGIFNYKHGLVGFISQNIRRLNVGCILIHQQSPHDSNSKQRKLGL